MNDQHQVPEVLLTSVDPDRALDVAPVRCQGVGGIVRGLGDDFLELVLGSFRERYPSEEVLGTDTPGCGGLPVPSAVIVHVQAGPEHVVCVEQGLEGGKQCVLVRAGWCEKHPCLVETVDRGVQFAQPFHHRGQGDRPRSVVKEPEGRSSSARSRGEPAAVKLRNTSRGRWRALVPPRGRHLDRQDTVATQ